MKPHLWFIRSLSRIVPLRWRSEWQQEWEAELHHRQSLGRPGLLRRSLGAFWDALAMQPRRLEEEMFQDVHFGLRMFAKNKALTITAIFSLALGIGANTALFSMVDAVLLKKLPVRNPDELVLFQWTAAKGFPGLRLNAMVFDGTYRDPKSGLETNQTFSDATFHEFREHNRTLSQVFAFARLYHVTLVADDRPDAATGQMVSGGYFAGLGVDAAAGRPITDDDDRPSASPVAVISYRYWERRFALDPSILGKTIKVNDVPFTLVGVTPPGFDGTLQVGDSPDVSVPMSFQPLLVSDKTNAAMLSKPDAWWLWIMARRKPGVSADQVRGDLEGSFLQTALDTSSQSGDGKPSAPRLGVVSGSRGLSNSRQDYTEPLMILAIMVGLVLLIACANVANLLMARSSTRQKEIAVRLAIGAGRFRLIRQVLTESVLLAAFGGICGAVFAYFTKDLLLRWGPWTNSATPLTLKLDLRTLAFTGAISLLAGIAFGLAPAFGSTRHSLNATMKDGGRTPAGGSYTRKALLVLQIALSTMILIAAGLFVRSLHNLHGVVAGFDPGSLLQFDIDPSLVKLDPAKVTPLFEQMIERIESIPGVKSASVASGEGNFLGFKDKGSGRAFLAGYSHVRENFFDTMGIPLIAGRGFGSADNLAAQHVVIVNEAFVHKYFPDISPLGQTANGEIVGVVRDSKLGRFRQNVAPAIYYPYRQSGYGRMTFRIRTRVNPASIVPDVRRAVSQVDAQLPISNVRTLAEQVDQSLAKENMFADLSALFGVLALTLACVGFYGLLAYSVARRTNEIGIRVALGATRFDVLWLVMGEGLFLVLIGSAIGIGGALASSGYIASILFDLAPNDGFTIILAVLAMASIATLASFIPARKATGIDPLAALRYE